MSIGALGSWLQINTARLAESGINSARLDCLVLLEYVLREERSSILAHPERKLEGHHLKELNTMIMQRSRRTPLAYIVGSKEFYGHHFMVNETVLIPRPESEAMLELLQKFARKNKIQAVIDIGTGSGCLAISAALALPDIHICATDVSKDALKVARRNSLTHDARVKFYLSDLLIDIPEVELLKPYVLIANLPYVPEGLVTSPEITKEPAMALFSGNDGLKHYRQFWHQIENLKNKPLAVITESLISQHSALSHLAETTNYKLQTAQDLAQLFIKSSAL
ncbi:MAG: peptide chain release factor N(5)-glutamine methyltransferase [Candidatus Saccharimonadales bacterium]